MMSKTCCLQQKTKIVRSSLSVTKTPESKIAKLGTGIVHHNTMHDTIVQRSMSQAHKGKKVIEWPK